MRLYDGELSCHYRSHTFLAHAHLIFTFFSQTSPPLTIRKSFVLRKRFKHVCPFFIAAHKSAVTVSTIIIQK